MGNVFLQIVILGVLLLLNGVFAMSEMAIVSARKTRLQQLANSGSRGAREALHLIEAPTRFLSTIQIGITLVGILMGTFGGASLSARLAEFLSQSLSFPPDWARGVSVVLVVTLITYFSVLIGELIPKRLALKFPESIAALTSLPMTLLSKVSAPVVWFFTHSTEFVLRLLRLDLGERNAPVTHEEIKAIVEQSAQEGMLENAEKEMVARVLSFGEKRVTSLMTPAHDVVWVNAEESLESQRDKILDSPHSEYPVAHGDLDHLVGTLHAKDLWCAGGPCPRDLKALLYPPLYVPESATARQVLETFKATGFHMGFVLDEYGAIQGLVTLNNLLEAIVGDLPARGAVEPKPIMQRDDGSWLVDGVLPIDELKETLGIATLPGEREGLFHTVAGFVMSQLGRVPIQTDAFEWLEWRFEVVDMDRNRIDKVLVSRRPVMPPAPLESYASSPHP